MRMEENSTKKNEVRAESRKLAWQCIVTISNSTHKGNAQFEFLFQKSGMVYRARFIKAVLLDKEIKVVKIDKATMDYDIHLTNFYHQFQSIGNNYNQTVMVTKTNFGEKRAYTLLHNLEKVAIDLVILILDTLVLKCHHQKRDHAYGQESQRQHPPVHQRTVGEVLQSTVHAVPGDWSTENKAYQQYPEVAYVEPIQDLSRRRSQHLAHGNLFPLVLALEHDKVEHAHDRNKDSDKAEQGDQGADLQFLFVGTLQNLVYRSGQQKDIPNRTFPVIRVRAPSRHEDHFRP